MENRDTKRSWWAGWRPVEEEEGPIERVLEARIERLHREVRRSRYLLALFALMLVGAGVAWYQQSGTPTLDVIRARKIQIVTPEGRNAVVLDTDREGGRIALRYNREGEPAPPAIFLSAAPNGGAIQLFEPGRNFYALGFEVGPGGEGVLKVRARAKQAGVELRGPTAQRPGGELVVFNGEGREAVRLATDATGHGVVSANGASPN